MDVDQLKFSAIRCGRLSHTQHHLCAGATTSEQDQGMCSDPDVRELKHLALGFFEKQCHSPPKNLLWPKISLRINKQEFDDEIGRFDDEDVQATSFDWRSDSSKRFSSRKQCVKRSDFPYVFPGLIIEVLETYAMFVATQLAQSSLLKPAIWLCISSRIFFHSSR